ncbi:MAG: glycosyltransferase, partial [SAR202 cluster bacterium]|nr:glycosyltransferase [SAR202 cluster bacterium]
MVENSPIVSVVMNCLNCEDYVREAIESVYAQTFTDWEIIFWDNNSIDKSAKIAKSFDSRLKYYKSDTTDLLGKARNKALNCCTGNYIAFLDCDDLWLPKKLENQIPIFENSEIGIVYCDSIFFNDEKDLYRLYSKEKPLRGHVFKGLLDKYILSMETVVIRKSALEDLDHYFDETFSMAEETDLFLRIAYNWSIDYVDEPLAKWRMHDKSESQLNSYLVPKEKELILQKLSKIFPDFEDECSDVISRQRRTIDYQWGLSFWESGDGKTSRQYFKKHIKKTKFLILYILTFLTNHH